MIAAGTLQDRRRRIQRVMLHVDRNLDRSCKLENLARVACYSPFHFNRTFEAIMGETPHRYVYRKRMERAGWMLLNQNRRIIDIALDVGYETASAFCKGFKAFSGHAPRCFRDTTSLSWYLKTNRPFHPADGCDQRPAGRLTPKIRMLPPLTVVARENRGIVNGSFLKTGADSFNQLRACLVEAELSHAVQAYVGLYPVRLVALADDAALSYAGAVISGCQRVPEGLISMRLPAGRYAVFNHQGPYEFMMQTWNAAYLGWLPRSKAVLRDAVPFEIYLAAASPVNPLQSSALIFIPIQ